MLPRPDTTEPASELGALRDDLRSKEPWGRRLWLAVALVVVIAFGLESYGISQWPMADDEVPSLVELNLLHIGAEKFFSVPPDQIAKLPKATPVWNAAQRFAVGLLPASEVSYRIPGLVCGLLTSALMFLLVARWRGLWFAAAFAILLHESQLFIFLQQLNRFYSLPLLLLVAGIGSMWVHLGGVAMIAVTVILTALAVLSHNVTVAVFVLTFLAACPAYLIGRAPRHLVVRSGAAALTSVLIYLLYLRPIVSGWSSTGNPTPVLMSFTAHASLAVLALALFGAWLAVVRPQTHPAMLWWTLMFAGSVCLFQFAPIVWNPRYFLFFLPAAWALAAHAMDFVADRAGRGLTGAVWYGCIALVLLPNLLSHYADGSRHDYRQAAAVLTQSAQPGQPIFSDDAETLTYYLPETLRQRLEVRTRVRVWPQGEFFLVCRSNAWMPLIEVPHRRMELLAEIYRRRYDQFSHILRVYRVEAAQ